MAATNLGNVAVVPVGTWSNANTYKKNNLVSNAGNMYIAKKDVPTGIAISNTTYWMLSASRGNDGDVTTAAMNTAINAAKSELEGDLNFHASARNPHNTRASDVGALPTTGGQLTGPLTVKANEIAQVNFSTTTGSKSGRLSTTSDGASRLVVFDDSTNHRMLVLSSKAKFPSDADALKITTTAGSNVTTYTVYTDADTGAVRDSLKLHIRAYSSVSQLSLSVGSATINACFTALPVGSYIEAPASDFASSEVPSTAGVVKISKVLSIRAYCIFEGKMQGDGNYRKYLNTAGTAFLPEWYKRIENNGQSAMTELQSSWTNVASGSIGSGITTPSTFGNGRLRYRLVGKQMFVAGGFSTAFTASKEICTLPYGVANTNQYFLQACSGGNIARIYIRPDKALMLEWVRSLDTGAIDTSFNGWIDCNLSFWID